MKLSFSAHKKLKKLPLDDAKNLIAGLTKYEKNQRGYIKWLDNRPGYRITIGDYHVTFEYEDKHNEIIIFSILKTL